tara:strand:- start:31 stop:450 length:420 start_codon:yes stop_codon:yes gene_type:complete
MKKGIIVSGYFNPLHKGHIEYFKLAKKHGDILIVIVNNDFQRSLKNSKEFMDEKERLLIISELKLVDKVYLSEDKDRTVNKSLQKVYVELGPKYKLFFANGGDQNNDLIPEKDTCDNLGIDLIDSLGDKIQSSSWLLKK